MRVYADSSFLVSCYLPDANTAEAQAYLAGRDVSLVFTELHDLEVRNALQLGVFRKVITRGQARRATTNINADLRAGRLLKTPVRWPTVFRLATTLSRQHASVTGTRSLDILHIAAARTLRLSAFASFDSRQRVLAIATGLANALEAGR